MKKEKLTEVELPVGTYSLRRDYDGAGDSGMLFESLSLDGDKNVVVDSKFVRVGSAVKVGSPYARTFEYQDWWMTTPVTEIKEVVENEDEFIVYFKTKNSDYTLKVYQ